MLNKKIFGLAALVMVAGLASCGSSTTSDDISIDDSIDTGLFPSVDVPDYEPMLEIHIVGNVKAALNAEEAGWDPTYIGESNRLVWEGSETDKTNRKYSLKSAELDVDKEFKFLSGTGWNTEIKTLGNVVGLNEVGDTIDGFKALDGGNIKVLVGGKYDILYDTLPTSPTFGITFSLVEADPVKEFVPSTNIHVVGTPACAQVDGNGWKPEFVDVGNTLVWQGSDTDTANRTYKLEGVELVVGDLFKLVDGLTWNDKNYNASILVATDNASGTDNIEIATAGTYTIVLDVTSGAESITLTKTA